MADQNALESGLVFCHSCDNEWMQEDHGLQCPQCHSEAVEIIDPGSDPRAEEAFGEFDFEDDPIPSYFGRGHVGHDDAPDPDEEDIHNVAYGGLGDMEFSSTTYTTGGRPGTSPMRAMPGNDLFPQLLSNILGVTQPQVANRTSRQGQQQQQSQSPLQEGPFRMGSPPTMRSSIRITASGFGPGGMRSREVASEDIAGIFNSILQGIGGGHGFVMHGHAGSPMGQQQPNPFEFIARMLDPANARHGDAVFTNEALDRVISQLMEQHGGSTAPGPASDAAIAALSKIKIGEEHLGENGLAECSICMDQVEVGDEVTQLPCKHWFHDDCVAPWLREHDSCPQCRFGITPKEGDADRPRNLGEAPRFWQMPEGGLQPEADTSPGSGSGEGSSTHRSTEGRSNSGDPRGPSRRAPENRSFSSGISNIMGRLRGSSGSNGGSHGSHSNSHSHHRHPHHHHHHPHDGSHRH